MKQIRQLEFDALPIIDGRKACPSDTDYSLIKVFGEGCSFGKGRSYAELTLNAGYPIFQMAGVGRGNRGVIAWNTTGGVRIECGCFRGTLAEFREQVDVTHAEGSKHNLIYQGSANMCEVQFG